MPATENLDKKLMAGRSQAHTDMTDFLFQSPALPLIWSGGHPYPAVIPLTLLP